MIAWRALSSTRTSACRRRRTRRTTNATTALPPGRSATAGWLLALGRLRRGVGLARSRAGEVENDFFSSWVVDLRVCLRRLQGRRGLRLSRRGVPRRKRTLATGRRARTRHAGAAVAFARSRATEVE